MLQLNYINFPNCTGINIVNDNDAISIHFYFNSHTNADIFYNNLPLWISKLGEVVLGFEQVFVIVK